MAVMSQQQILATLKKSADIQRGIVEQAKQIDRLRQGGESGPGQAPGNIEPRPSLGPSQPNR
jgi:hypothetical protein